MSFEILDRSGCLHVSVAGKFSLREAKQIFVKALEAAARQRMSKVLVDGRTLTGDLPTLERFHLAKFTAEKVLELQSKGLSADAKFACVLEEPLLDPERFGETVAVNRGMLLKVFDNLEDALDWLEVAPANELDVVDD